MNPPKRRHTVLLDGEYRVLQLGALVAHRICGLFGRVAPRAGVGKRPNLCALSG